MSETNLLRSGFTIIPQLFSPEEVSQLISVIDACRERIAAHSHSQDLFAMRRFLHQAPDALPFFTGGKFRSLVDELASPSHQIVKSIYFDKPERSNWFVARHQDLTISVRDRIETEGFHFWTHKQGQHAVQPPLQILQDIFTFRIHLDDTDEHNGALWVVPGTQDRGIVRPASLDWSQDSEVPCPVPRGGVMVMRPLLMHRSQRTLDARRRRVIHLECSSMLTLPNGLEWSEKMDNGRGS